MFDLSDPKIFWLNVTNIVLGIVTLVCCAVVGYGLVQEVLVRLRKSKSSSITDGEHTFLVSGVGVTMADGGKRIIETSPDLEKEKASALKPNLTRFQKN